MSIKQFVFCGKHSQNGEQGIIDEALKRIKPTLKVAVEFGGADGYYCSNTAHLREQGWKVNMYDLNEVPDLVTAKEITVKNINELPKCTVLSIDTDGADYLLWKAYNGKPDIMIIEINSGLNPDIDYFLITKGTNFSMMNKLAELKGYFLLAHTGNCIYILNKHISLFPDKDSSFIKDWL